MTLFTFPHANLVVIRLTYVHVYSLILCDPIFLPASAAQVAVFVQHLRVLLAHVTWLSSLSFRKSTFLVGRVPFGNVKINNGKKNGNCEAQPRKY